jgi:hypothetical protein
MKKITDVALTVARAFEKAGMTYFLGGSLASSMQGEPRATNDIDFVVEMTVDQVQPLVDALGLDFDVDVEALTDAIRQRRSWNIYYLPSATKIDLFIRQSSPFDESEFSRRRPLEVRPGESIVLKSPEDTVLRKLLWFRSGGEVSSTQWRDVVEVLRVSGGGLDTSYLNAWAERLAVKALLARAWAEAGKPSSP